MATTTTVQNLLDRHAQGLYEHKQFPTIAELVAAGKAPHIAVVTCADPRCIAENFLHLDISDAVIFRNPGGSAVSALPGILALDTLIGIYEIMVIKHTDCGAALFRDTNIREILKKRAPELATEVDAMQFNNITATLEDKVKEDLQFLKGSNLVRKELADRCVGFVYDVKTGALAPVQ